MTSCFSAHSACNAHCMQSAFVPVPRLSKSTRRLERSKGLSARERGSCKCILFWSDKTTKTDPLPKNKTQFHNDSACFLVCQWRREVLYQGEFQGQFANLITLNYFAHIQSPIVSIIGERAKRARHSQVCSIENRIYIFTRKMVPITGRARSFLLVFKNKIERRGRQNKNNRPINLPNVITFSTDFKYTTQS